MPLDCGSTKPNTICTAMAASTAEPPAFNISKPACVANGLAAATANFGVTTSALRVKPVAISGWSGALLVGFNGAAHAQSKANAAAVKLQREALAQPKRLTGSHVIS
jgi:hypothetical protein